MSISGISTWIALRNTVSGERNRQLEIQKTKNIASPAFSQLRHIKSQSPIKQRTTRKISSSGKKHHPTYRKSTKVFRKKRHHS